MPFFFAGIIVSSMVTLLSPAVPALSAFWLIIPLAMLCAGLRRYFLLGVCCYLLGWIWHYQAHTQAATVLLQQQKQWVSGEIISIPSEFNDYSQFLLKVSSGDAAGFSIRLNRYQHHRHFDGEPIADSQTVLSSQTAPLLQAGQHWQFYVSLKPVHGVANPGSINREANALVNGVIAQGYILPEHDAVLLQDSVSLRQRLVSMVQRETTLLSSGPVMLALAVGERDFDSQLWLGLQNSALGHLMAISGLHIGLVFGWCLALSLWLLRYCRLTLYQRKTVALLLAIMGAVGYSWAAGFAIPTIRAIVALSILVIGWLQLRHANMLYFWLFVTATLLLCQPFYAISISFWLSVLAVGFIFLVLWRYPLQQYSWKNRFIQFCRFHCWLTLLMFLLTILLFGGGSPLALLSNMVFVPWCSLLAIPVLMLALVAEMLSLPAVSYLWQLADMLFLPMIWWLNWCAESGLWWSLPHLPVLITVAVMCGAVLFLLLRQKRVMAYCMLLLLPGLVLSQQKDARWQLHLVDVGQGLAVLLQQGKHALLYDAGPRFGEFSATEAYLLPLLRYQGINKLDYLILSHDDSDHTGHWPLLQQTYPDVTVVTDISHIHDALPCEQLTTDYRGAEIQWLTTDIVAQNKNDSSCVFTITVNGWRLLLTGDISSRVETALLAQYPQLQTDVLVLSHHGSNTSSSLAFLQQLKPQLALNSAGFMNQHRHPATAVTQRLQALDIPLLNTAEQGMVSLYITDSAVNISRYRERRFPLWLQKPVGNAETLLTTR